MPFTPAVIACLINLLFLFSQKPKRKFVIWPSEEIRHVSAFLPIALSSPFHIISMCPCNGFQFLSHKEGV